MNKKLLIRADGNAEIGAGHIMRCMSIGNTAKKIGLEVVFVTADNSFINVLEENKLDTRVLNTHFNKMSEEINRLRPILEEEKPDYILVDSYYITDDYLKNLREYAKLVYIDDVLAFPYPVDVLVNYNIYASKARYEELYAGGDTPELLIGSQYIPLREEFQNGDAITIKSVVDNVLFTAGGADPERVALKFVENVSSKCEMNDINFHIVIGGFEPDKDAIINIASAHSNILTYQNVRKMSELMKKCDVAVSAAGSTLYELCSYGVPTITYTLADNQIPGATTFEQKGAMINAGDDRDNLCLMDSIIEKLMCLSFDYDRRLSMHNKMKSCVNGNGALQIVGAITGM